MPVSQLRTALRAALCIGVAASLVERLTPGAGSPSITEYVTWLLLGGLGLALTGLGLRAGRLRATAREPGRSDRAEWPPARHDWPSAR